MPRRSKAERGPGDTTDTSGRPRFVVQEHHATHLHWDFRLEMDGVLRSWAVPKEPPSQPGVKRLAVAVADHPLDYIDFQGSIPEGEYGAGSVKIWDGGHYRLLGRSEKILEIELQGHRLRGQYLLVHTGGKNWLLFKRKG